GVDHRYAAGGDVIAVAHAAGRLPRDVLAEVRSRSPDELEQGLGVFGQRLGRAPEAAMNLDVDLVLLRGLVDGFGDEACGDLLVVGGARPHVHPQNGKVWNDIARPATIDPRGIDR